MTAPVHVSTHPLIQHKLARLRAAETKPPEFRELVAAISRVLFFEATRDAQAQAGLDHDAARHRHVRTRSPRRSGWCRCCGPGSAWPRRCSTRSPRRASGTSASTATTPRSSR